MKDLKNKPSFRVTKTNPPIVYLRCSQCDKDIRKMGKNESIRITRAYYCEECDPGCIVLNPPSSQKIEIDE